MRNVIIVVVMAGMVPLGYNGSIYSQFGLMIIFIPLANAFYKSENKNAQYE